MTMKNALKAVMPDLIRHPSLHAGTAWIAGQARNDKAIKHTLRALALLLGYPDEKLRGMLGLTSVQLAISILSGRRSPYR